MIYTNRSLSVCSAVALYLLLTPASTQGPVETWNITDLAASYVYNNNRIVRQVDSSHPAHFQDFHTADI